MPFPTSLDVLTDGVSTILAAHVKNLQNITIGPIYYNVRGAPYNAVGDGVVDDAPAINAAIAAIPAIGGTILFPPTTNNIYRCASPIVVNKANVMLQFQGGAVLKAANGLNADLLQLVANNIFMLDGIVDGNKANNTSGTGITINSPTNAVNTSGVTLLNTAVQNCIGYGINVTATGTGSTTTATIISQCSVTNTNTGIFINGRGGGGNGQVDITVVRDCVINTTVQHGMISTGANRTIFEGNTIIGAGLNKVSGFSHGIAIDGNAASNPNQEHRIANNRVTTPYDAGIEVADGITACYIAGNTILGAGNGATPAATYGLYFGGGFTLSSRAQIIGNHVTTSKGAGIMVSGVDATHLTKNVSVVGNTCVANGNDGIFIQFATNCTVSGNTCDGNSVGNSNNFSGIDLNVVTNTSVTGNISTDTQGVPTQSRGVNERGASNNNIIVGNYVAGNVTASYIVIVGAATIAWGNIGAAADNGIVKGGLQVIGGIAMDGATLNAARINMPTTWGLQVAGGDAITLATGLVTANLALVSAKDRRISKQSPAFAASPAPDPTAGEIYAMAALTGAVTVANPVNAAQGQRLLFIWTQDGTGGRTVTYSGTNWRSVGIAAQTTTLSTVTIDEAVCVDGTLWRVNRLVTGQTI